MTDKDRLLATIRTTLERDSQRLPLAGDTDLTVSGEGSSHAQVVFIGEAAGYHELLERRPFVGAAGKLLTTIMEHHGIPRSTVWITNVVKARPPQNRDPLPEEIESYRPYLDAELQVLTPRIIVTLGRFSMAKFLGEQVRISQIHGVPRWVTYTPRPQPVLEPNHTALRFVLLPMYHPAAALRSDVVRTQFEHDFERLPDIQKKVEEKNDKIASVTTNTLTPKQKEGVEQLNLC